VTNYHHFPETLSIPNSRYRLMTHKFHNNLGRSAKTIMPTGRETQKETMKRKVYKGGKVKLKSKRKDEVNVKKRRK
jgi:hypothetical protein